MTRVMSVLYLYTVEDDGDNTGQITEPTGSGWGISEGSSSKSSASFPDSYQTIRHITTTTDQHSEHNLQLTLNL